MLAYASGVLLFIGQPLSESSHHYGLYRALVIILPVFFFCGLFLQYGAGVRIMWACSAVDVLMVYILYSELTQKIDTLTHLLNRRSYESRLASLRGHAVIYYFDVDEFKSVNDTFGHGVGDAVLAEVGSTIYAVFSKVGYCYRIGGDEFAVIMVDMSRELYYTITNKIAEINGLLAVPEDGLPAVSLSAGVAFSDENGFCGSLFRAADSALYTAKAHGRCGCSVSPAPDETGSKS